MMYIGIDTGEHTGFAVWDSRKKAFAEIRTLHLHQALEKVKELNTFNNITIVVEDARLRKFIPREKSVSEYRGKLMGAGSVKRDAKIWEEFCKDREIPFELVPPMKGATKLNPDLFAHLTGWTGRTSNHARDAAMLVLGR